MKFIIAAVAFCAVAAYAASDINSLLERATELEGSAQKVINEFHNHSKSHLLSALEYEFKQLQPIVAHVKHLAGNASTVRTHEVNQAEEKLLHAENRFNEELDFVLAVYSHNSTGKSDNELVNYAQVLIKEANAALATHKAHRDVYALKNAISDLEYYSKDMVAHPTGRRHERDEETLIRYEYTIRNLLQRLENDH